MMRVGRHLWRSLSPTPLLEQAHLDQVALNETLCTGQYEKELKGEMGTCRKY